MKKKYFLKGQSSLQRKVVAGTLSAVFGVGMYGSYAGAMEQPLQPENIPQQVDQYQRISANIKNFLNKNFSKDDYEFIVKHLKAKNKEFDEGLLFSVYSNEKFCNKDYWIDFAASYLGVSGNDKKKEKIKDIPFFKSGSLPLYFFSEANYDKNLLYDNFFTHVCFSYKSYPWEAHNAFGNMLDLVPDVKKQLEEIKSVPDEEAEEKFEGNEENEKEKEKGNILENEYGEKNGEDKEKNEDDKEIIGNKGIKLENLKGEKQENNKKKIVIGLVVSVVVLAILAVIITVAFKLNNNANNQNSDKTDGKPDGGNGSTNPNNNNPEPTKDEDQQGAKQTGSSSILPQVLKYGGAVAGTGTAIAGGIAAVRSGKKSNDKEAGANNKTSYAYIDSDKVKAANAENERKDDENKGNENKDDNKDNSEDNNKDGASGDNEDLGTAKDSTEDEKA